MKLTKPFYGVPDGAIYPVHYQAGDECPPELQAAAQVAGCLQVADDLFSQPEKPAGKNKDKDKSEDLGKPE